MLRVNLSPKQHLLLIVNILPETQEADVNIDVEGFYALLHQSKQDAKDVPFVSEHVPETQEENDENKEESDYEDGVEESQEGNHEDGAEDDEEGVDDTQFRVRAQVRVRTRKPSKRIIENMLKKIVVEKKGIRMAP
ncbi:unnamed protein product [Lactuca saligna]|uniref:Uncharacterized protein n=1 Tax=Lactuca saligna TaxID=75948 RepID=A0AA36DVE6_LACSI|nr:unnamed protein product [Lactuca saligna]